MIYCKLLILAEAQLASTLHVYYPQLTQYYEQYCSLDLDLYSVQDSTLIEVLKNIMASFCSTVCN